MDQIDTVASLYSRGAIVDILRESVKNIFVPITVGGGIKSLDDAINYFEHGADKIFINTAAVSEPRLIDELVKHFGKANITLSVEAKEVEKIVVVNKEIAQIFIKDNALDKEKHSDVSKNSFTNSKNKGPHYFFEIPSVEIFNDQVIEAQQELYFYF